MVAFCSHLLMCRASIPLVGTFSACVWGSLFCVCRLLSICFVLRYQSLDGIFSACVGDSLFYVFKLHPICIVFNSSHLRCYSFFLKNFIFVFIKIKFLYFKILHFRLKGRK